MLRVVAEHNLQIKESQTVLWKLRRKLQAKRGDSKRTCSLASHTVKRTVPDTASVNNNNGTLYCRYTDGQKRVVSVPYNAPLYWTRMVTTKGKDTAVIPARLVNLPKLYTFKAWLLPIPSLLYTLFAFLQHNSFPANLAKFPTGLFLLEVLLHHIRQAQIFTPKPVQLILQILHFSFQGSNGSPWSPGPTIQVRTPCNHPDGWRHSILTGDNNQTPLHVISYHLKNP